MPPLGLISSFSLLDKAGYSCYVRAAYCDTGTEYHDDSSPGTRTFILTDRIEGSINLGDNVVRSLKDVGIPDGAEVQLVIELIAASHPKIISQESYTFSESSFRTASYICHGTVFNPSLEKAPRKLPPPPVAVMTQSHMQDEKTALLADKVESNSAVTVQKHTWLPTWACCNCD
ncbi:hypothetical protein EMMF5_000453 [Cystobasidiomycetes sp. EMM_F5]